MPRIAINGLGRVGRAALKVMADLDELDLVAVNDLASPRTIAPVMSRARHHEDRSIASAAPARGPSRPASSSAVGGSAV